MHCCTVSSLSRGAWWAACRGGVAWASPVSPLSAPWAACGGCVAWASPVSLLSVLWAGAPSHTTPDQGSQGGGRRCWLASRSPPQYLVVTHPTQHEENTISSWQGRHRVFFKNSESWRSVSYLNGVLGVWKRHIGIQKHKSFSCLVSACVFLTTSSIILICRAL